METIEFKKISKTYDNKKVLDIEYLKLNSGCFYGILGTNGAGKSTLVKIMLGLIPPDNNKETSKKGLFNLCTFRIAPNGAMYKVQILFKKI